jgi:hypothetical protein
MLFECPECGRRLVDLSEPVTPEEHRDCDRLFESLEAQGCVWHRAYDRLHKDLFCSPEHVEAYRRRQPADQPREAGPTSD